jgi:hypothetical protein
MGKVKPQDYRTNPRGRPEGYVTLRRAAEICQCSQTTISRLVAKRRLHVIRWRYRTLVREKDLREWSRPRRYLPMKLAVHAQRLAAREENAANPTQPMEEAAASVPAAGGTEAPEAPTAMEAQG